MLVDKDGNEWTAERIRTHILDDLVEFYWEAAYDDFIKEHGLDDQAVQDELYGEGTC